MFSKGHNILQFLKKKLTKAAPNQNNQKTPKTKHGTRRSDFVSLSWDNLKLDGLGAWGSCSLNVKTLSQTRTIEKSLVSYCQSVNSI